MHCVRGAQVVLLVTRLKLVVYPPAGYVSPNTALITSANKFPGQNPEVASTEPYKC